MLSLVTTLVVFVTSAGSPRVLATNLSKMIHWIDPNIPVGERVSLQEDKSQKVVGSNPLQTKF